MLSNMYEMHTQKDCNTIELWLCIVWNEIRNNIKRSAYENCENTEEWVSNARNITTHTEIENAP